MFSVPSRKIKISQGYNSLITHSNSIPVGPKINDAKIRGGSKNKRIRPWSQIINYFLKHNPHALTHTCSLSYSGKQTCKTIAYLATLHVLERYYAYDAILSDKSKARRRLIKTAKECCLYKNGYNHRLHERNTHSNVS